MKFILGSLLVAFSLSSLADNSMNKMKDKANTTMSGPTQLDDLIRGEMAAVKSYNEILEDVKDKNERTKLEKIKANHENAVSKLKGFASTDVKEDTEGAGAWGAFASAWTGGAKIMGNDTALKALTQGEEHGVKEYKEALNDEKIQPELKQMIRTQFLPKQEEHIKTIKGMM